MDKKIPHPNALEAADINTAPERLAYLAHNKSLWLLLAANPATPSAILERISKTRVPEERRVLAKNPNTPEATLFMLAIDFPHEFLANPLIPLLYMVEPDFMRKFDFQAWKSLLRCEEIPDYFLHFLQQDPQKKRQLEMEIANHIGVSREINANWTDYAKEAMFAYNKNADRYNGITPHHTFANLMLLFPQLYNDTLLIPSAKFTFSNKQIYLSNVPVSPQTLALLPYSGDIGVSRALALHPNTPIEVLAKLAQGDPAVRKAVVNNPAAPIWLIEKLAENENVEVRCAVARCHRTPLYVLEVLAVDFEDRVQTAVAGHQVITEEIGWILFNSPVSEVRAALARNVHTPQEILSALLYDPSIKVRAALARNPRLPQDAFTVLAEDPEEEVRAGLAGNSQLPPDLLENLAKSSPDIRRQLAANPRAPLALLLTFLAEGDMACWEMLASNPRATPEILDRLARQGNSRVQNQVAGHKRTPVDTLVWLSEQDEYGIWQRLVTNPHTPLAVLEDALARFSRNNSAFAARIAHHLALGKHRKRILLEYFSENMQQENKRNPSIWLNWQLLNFPELPIPLMKVYASSPNWVERYMIAQHPALPVWLLKQLARDGHRYVRAEAKSRLEQR